MRKRIFEIIEKSSGDDKLSTAYDIFMIIVILVSLLPLAFKTEPVAFVLIDRIAVTIFIVDYVLRWITADYKYNDHRARSFLKYPFSLMAIIDLISILPSLSILNNAFRLLRILRMLRAFRVLRVFKAFRYSKNIEIIANVLRNSKGALTAVCVLAGGYIMVAALMIFNVEPESFENFFDAIYWATISLTTVGYGDIYPTSTIGRIITMISSIIGIAIVALPAGIITAGYMSELEKKEGDN